MARLCSIVLLCAVAYAWQAPLLAAEAQPAPGEPNLPQLRRLVFLPEAQQQTPAVQQKLTDWFLYRVRSYQQVLEGDAIASLVKLGNFDAYRARMARNGGDPTWTVVFRDRNGGGPTKNPDEPFVFPNDGVLDNILDPGGGDTATCWHEMQHGVLSARNLSTRGLYGADQEHVYMETYAQPTVAWLRDLNQTKQFERLVREANDRALEQSRSGVEITPAIERDIWGRAAQAWRSAFKGTAGIAVLDENLRQEYFTIAGVRVPTVNEVIAFYESGAMKAANGDAIRVPVWLMCRELCLDIVVVQRQPVAQPPSVPGQVRKAVAFRLVTVRDSPAGAARPYPVERGRLRVKLQDDDEEAVISVSSGTARFSGIPVPGGNSTSLFDLDLATVRQGVDPKVAPVFEVRLVRAHPEQLTQKRTYHIEAEYSDDSKPPRYDTTKAVFLLDVAPPPSLAIEGPQETPVGREVTLTSTTGPRTPAGQAALAGTRVDWLVGGRVVHSGPQFRPDVTEPGEIQVQARLAREADVLATSGIHVLRVVAPASTLSTPVDTDSSTPSQTVVAAVAAPKAPAPTSLTLELPGFWGHLGYTITGAALDSPTGGDRGRVAGRQYKGQLVGDTLSVSGTAVSDNESSGPGSGDYYELVVSVTVGKDSRDFSYTAPKGEKMHKPFSLSIPVDPGATSAGFRISLLEENANNGEYGWVVGGSLTRDPAVPLAQMTAPAPATTTPRPTPSTAERLRAYEVLDEAYALKDAGKLTEAVAKMKESLGIVSDPVVEEMVQLLEETIELQNETKRRNQERGYDTATLEKKLAESFRAEGQELEAAGKLREAIDMYRDSLTYLPDPKLEGYVNGLEAALRAASAAAPASAAQAAPSPAPAAPSPAPAVSEAAPQVPVEEPQVDPKQREKALRLRAEGEKEEANHKPGKALEKYRKSLELLPDPALDQRVRDLGPLAEREELEKKAKRLRDMGRAWETLNQPAEAAKKYRESVALVPDPELERKAGQLEAMAASQAQEPQAPAPPPPQPGGAAGQPEPQKRTVPPAGAAACSVSGEWWDENKGGTAGPARAFVLRQNGANVAGVRKMYWNDQVFDYQVSGTLAGSILRLSYELPGISGGLVRSDVTGTLSASCDSMQATTRASGTSDWSTTLHRR